MEKLIARIKFGRKPGITITEAGEEFEVESEYAKRLVDRNFASYKHKIKETEKAPEVEKELKNEPKTKELKAPVKTKEHKSPSKNKSKAK